MNVTDANGCSVTQSASLSAPNAPVITSVVDTQISCNGLNNGSLQIQATGSSLLSYTLQPGSLTNGSGYFGQLSPNTYTITISDVSNCTVSTQVTISEPGLLLIDSLVLTQPTCIPGGDGSIVVYASGGSVAYQYSLGSLIQGSNTFSSLGGGLYVVNVTDANGCSVTQSATLSADPAPAILSVVDTNVTCFGLNNGSLQVTAQSSTSFNYTLIPGNITNLSGYYNNLSPNTYTVVLTDANGCTSSTSVVISTPALLTIDSLVTNIPSCVPGGDGSITVFATGGTPPLLYSIGGPGQSSNNFLNLNSSNYLVTVIDANNCLDTITVNLNTPSGPIITSVVDTNVSCFGLNNGSVQITGNGNSALTYSLQPGTLTNTTGYFNNLAPNTYTITLSDANNCSVTTQVVITEPSALNWNADTIVDVSCNGLSDGSINISASGGVGALIYTLQPLNVTNNSGSFTGLSANTYSITVTDANGCSIITSLNVSEPPMLVVDSVLTAIETCNPANDGTITVFASGGVAAYQYNLGAANQLSNVFLNLNAANYTVTVADANNCTVTTNATISAAVAPSIDSIAVTEATCNPGCDANATVYVSAGTSSTIDYSINGVVYQNTSTFNSLCASSYFAYVVDGNGCADTLAFSINTSVKPVIDSIIPSSTLCFGDSNGLVNIYASGGNGILNYSIIPTNQTNQTGIFSGLYATNYLLSIVDANGCQVDSNFSIINPPALQFTTTVSTDALCFGDSSGTINVAATGGTGTKSYTLLPNNITNSVGAFANLLGNATYTIVSTDANGCTLSTNLNVGEPSAVSDSLLQLTDVSCFGANNGSFSILGIGGNGPYSYNLTPGNINNTTGSFATLSGGIYTITITDANNCTYSTSIAIAEPGPLVFDSIGTIPVSCFGLSDGAIFVSAQGGVGGYSYNLQPGNITNTSGLFNNLTGNTYTVVVTDANACSLATTIVVNQPLAITLDSLLVTNATCAGFSNGTLSIYTSGGNGGNNYVLTPGNIANSTGIFTGLGANVYTITVTDTKGCSISAVGTIEEPQPLTAVFATDSVRCFGGNDGQVQVTASGGTQPYSYTLLPGAITNGSGVFVGLAANIYIVNITDSNGCTLSVNNILVEQPSQILFTNVTVDDVICYGDTTGKISVAANGGIGLITFDISPNVGSQATSGLFTGLFATNYIITATDAYNCTATTQVTVNQNPQIQVASLTITEPRCKGDTNGALSFTVIGGVGNLTYSFNGGPFNTDTVYSNLGVGTYTLNVLDSFGCSLDTSLVLTEPELVRVGSFELTPNTCPDIEDGKIVVVATGGRPYYTYYRRPGISFNRTGIFTDLKPGAYTITIIDSSGCAFDTTFNLLPNPNAMQTTIVKKDLPCTGYGDEGEASVIVNGGVPPYIYLWSTTPASTESKVTGLRFGYYFVEVLDALGCKITDTTYINPGDCCSEVFMPNAFSPNGDGNNDEFRVISTAGIDLLQFEIFNRWGQRIWQTSNYTEGWNGTFKGERQPIADYYYVFRYRCLTDGKEYIRKGNITLIR